MTTHKERGFEPPIVDLKPWLVANGQPVSVIGTRMTAQKVIAANPWVRPEVAVYIDCRDIRVMSSPFIDELLETWPFATPAGGGYDVNDTWAMVVERRAETAS